MTNCQKGDVVLVLFPNSDLRTAKRRPARVPLAVGSAEAKVSGLLTDSVVMTDNLATVHLNEIDRIIGRFPKMREVETALRVTFAI